MSDTYSVFSLTEPNILPFGDGSFTGAKDSAGASTPPGYIKGFEPQSNYFWEIPAIKPSVGERHPANAALSKRIVYINGINTTMKAHADTVKLLSVVSGAAVIGIYNQSGDGVSGNIVFDLVQCLGDKTGLSNNPATRTLAKAVYDACVSGVYLNIVAHSQGAIITSRAIRQGIGKLLDRYGRMSNQVRPLIEAVERKRNFFENVGRGIIGADDEDRFRLERGLRQYILPNVEERLHNFVSVQTFGGAGRFFPNGPIYRHVYNAWDPVPNLFGQGDIMTGPGRGARVQPINRNSGSPMPDFDDHSMDGVYLISSSYYVDRRGRKVDNQYVPIDMGMVRTK